MVMLLVFFCQNNRRIKGMFLGVEETIVFCGYGVSFQSFFMRHLVMAPARNYGIRKVISKGLCDVIDDRIVVVEHGWLCMKA